MEVLKLLCVLFLIVPAFATEGFNLADLRLKSFQKRTTETKSYRLPSTTKPLDYDLKFTVNLGLTELLPEDSNSEVPNFEGKAIIRIEVQTDTDTIILHSRKLQIKSIWITEEDHENWSEVSTYETDSDTEFLIIKLSDKLSASSKQLIEINFENNLNVNVVKGFYYTSYKNENEETRYLAAIHFPPINAREVFPCYDEPRYRARFTITLNHSSDFNANSNMPVRNTEDIGSGRSLTEFEVTPPMPSYLLAWTLTDFESIEKSSSISRVNQRLFARPEAIEAGLGDFSLDLGVEVFELQSKFFGVDYPLPKLDQVSIPFDDASGNENWGLIIYRDSLLLFDKRSHSEEAKHPTVKVVTHELAHQFFGDLVTIDFWEFVWIKEGLATLYEYYFANIVHPELKEDDFFITECLMQSLPYDSTAFATAMITYRESPSEIPGSFSFVSYQKSGTVLKMLQHAFGEEAFTQGIKYFLQDMSFKAATDVDLARNLQRALNEIKKSTVLNVQEILDTWTRQPGYPIVKVHTNEDGTLSISQEKFGHKSESTKNFNIPITFATENDPDFTSTKPKLWLNNTSDLLTLPELLNGWIILNVQAIGYYRVNYDGHLWRRIIRKLQSDSFTDVHKYNRALLIADLFAVASDGQHPYDLPLDLVSYLSKEKEYVVWEAADSQFKFLYRFLSDTKVNHYLTRFLFELTEPLYEEIDDNLITTPNNVKVLTQIKLENIIVDWACTSENRICLERANTVVNNELKFKENAIKDHMDVFFCNAIRYGDSNLFDTVKNFWSNKGGEENGPLREMLANSLGCSQNRDKLHEFLNDTLRIPGMYRPGEQNKCLYAVFQNGGPLGVELSIDFITENYLEIEEKYTQPTPVLFAVNYMAEYMTSERLNDKFKNMLDVLVRAELITESLKDLFITVTDSSVQWVKEHEEEIERFFKNYYKGGATVKSVSVGVLLISFLLHLFLNKFK